MSQLSQSVRKEVLKRDNYECRFCGVSNEQHKQDNGRSLHAHHIVKSRIGGPDDPENLIAVCRDCHDTIEQTQAKGLELLKSDKVAGEDQQQKVQELEKSLSEVKQQHDKAVDKVRFLQDALANVLSAHVSLDLHITHESATGSQLDYVGTSEKKAFEAYENSEWANVTMERRSASKAVLDVVDFQNVRDDDVREFLKETTESGNGFEFEIVDEIHQHLEEQR